MATLLLLLIVAVAVAIVYFMMKNGKIEDKNANNVPDKLEPMINDFMVNVELVEQKVVKAVKKTTTNKKTKKTK